MHALWNSQYKNLANNGRVKGAACYESAKQTAPDLDTVTINRMV